MSIIYRILLRTAIEAEILFAAHIIHLRFLGAVIKPVQGCTGLIARFAQQNVLLLRTTDIRVGTEKKTPPEQSSSGKKIGAESAVLHPSFLTGIGIVAGTIIEDIATLGVGIANAPATLALGFTLIAGTYSMVSHNRGCEK